MTSPAPSRIERVPAVWLAVAIGVAAAMPFLPALLNGFVTWDDDKNFLTNPDYRGLAWHNLKWMWTTFHLGHYVPLTWMTLGLDYVVWGMNPTGYHLTSIVLHGANAAIVFLVARRLLAAALGARNDAALTWAAAVAALMFAVHPLRVESVAWATERRDVLSGALYSLTVLLYLRALDTPPISKRRYAGVFFAFLAALLSKGTSMTLPAVLLIINVFPLRRLRLGDWRGAEARRVYKELLPLFMLSIAAVMMTIMALGFRPQRGLLEKTALTAYGIGFYTWKTLLPVSLGALYPMPDVIPWASMPFVASYALSALLVMIVVVNWGVRPGLIAALAAMFVMLLPMLGVVQNGPQITADRYTYHAAPALGILIAGAFWLAQRRAKSVARAGALLIVGAWSVLTWRQTLVWRDSGALWSQTAKVSPQSAIALNGLGADYLSRGKDSLALEYFRKSVAADPRYPESHVNVGVVLTHHQHFDEAVEHFRHALEVRPDYDDAENNWGVAMSMQGKLVEAIGHFRLALQMNPNHAGAEMNWGKALADGADFRRALPHFERAAKLNPYLPFLELHWGAALMNLGLNAEAVPHLERAAARAESAADARLLLQRAQARAAAGKASQ